MMTFRPTVAAVEVDFAEPLEAVLLDLRSALSETAFADFDVSGPPHISLAVGLGLQSPRHVSELEQAVGASLGSAPATVILDHVGAFPGEEQAVYLAPRAAEKLRDWHRLLWPAACRALTDPITYYAPANWIPHCTMSWGPGSPVDERVAWLRENVSLPLNAPLSAVSLRVYENGTMRQAWTVRIDE
jgi:2'-5' RNA ligase